MCRPVLIGVCVFHVRVRFALQPGAFSGALSVRVSDVGPTGWAGLYTRAQSLIVSVVADLFVLV